MSTSSKIRKTNSNIELSSHLVREVNVHFYTFFVMPKQKKRSDVDATASCPARFIHPSTPIRENYNRTHWKESLTNLFITGRQARSIRRVRKETEAYLLRHNDFDNVDFYAASQNVTVTAEGPSESLFEAPIRGNDDKNAAAEQERDEGGKENSEERQLLPLSVSAGQNMARDNFLDPRNA